MKKVIACLAVATTILSGCSKENENNITPVDSQEGLELGAIIPESRTYLNGKDVFWSEGDKLTVWSDQRTPLTYNLSSGANSASAIFTYTPTPAAPKGIVGNEFYAIYPQSPKTTVSGNQGFIELPNTQNCSSADNTANFESNFNPMAAVNDKLNNMVFYNLCGILVVEVTPDQDLNLTKIILNTNGSQPLCGAATVTFPAAGSGEKPTLNATDGSATELTLTCKNMSLTAGQKYSFYIVVPAGTYENMSVSIYTNKKFSEPTLYKVRANKAIEIAAGAITTIGANFDLITIEPEPLHQYVIGEKYPYSKDGSAEAEGIVFALTNTDRTEGKIMAIYDCGAEGAVYKWGPAKSTPVMGSLTDGLNNMAVATAAGIANYPAFEACQNLNTEGSDLNWYLPARDELQTIMDNYKNLEQTWRAITNKNEETDFMLPALNYWTSSMGGSRVTTIYYWTYEDASNPNGIMKDIAVSGLSNAEYAVRAVSHFTSK